MKAIEFNKDLDEMSEAELRATFRDFKGSYEDGKEQFDKFSKEREDLAEYKEKYEENEESIEAIGELKPVFAEMFSEMKDLDPEMVEDKFSITELTEELKEADVFSLPASDDDPEDDEENKFSERKQKSKRNDNKSEFSDRIDQFMKGRVRTH